MAPNALWRSAWTAVSLVHNGRRVHKDKGTQAASLCQLTTCASVRLTSAPLLLLAWDYCFISAACFIHFIWVVLALWMLRFTASPPAEINQQLVFCLSDVDQANTGEYAGTGVCVCVCVCMWLCVCVTV